MQLAAAAIPEPVVRTERQSVAGPEQTPVKVQ